MQQVWKRFWTGGLTSILALKMLLFKWESGSWKAHAERKRLMHIKQNANRGFSLIELLIVVAIILIIAAIAIPNLLRSRMAANQAAAVATLRNINNSQATYISQFAQIGYADTFVKMGPGIPCDSTHACLVTTTPPVPPLPGVEPA
jgi:prepilin-type N-terminal cleavage/methylation domain-containing protein